MKNRRKSKTFLINHQPLSNFDKPFSEFKEINDQQLSFIARRILVEKTMETRKPYTIEEFKKAKEQKAFEAYNSPLAA